MCKYWLFPSRTRLPLLRFAFSLTVLFVLSVVQYRARGTATLNVVQGENWDVIACAEQRMDAHLLQSWVLWNHAAGIDHFVILNNNDISPDGMQDDVHGAVEPLVQAGLVTVLNYYKDVMNNLSLADEYDLDREDYETLSRLSSENFLRKRCYDLYGHRAKWLAMIDVDEVIVSVKGRSLRDFLEQPRIRDDPHIGGVGFLWRTVHYSGHFLNPHSCDKFAPYRICDYIASDRHIKTIVRGHLQPSANKSLYDIVNSHFMQYNDGFHCVLEGSLDNKDGCDPTKTLYNKTWERPESLEFQLNHHFSRSFEEFLLKAMRGLHFKYEQDALRTDFADHQLCHPIFDWSTDRAAKIVEKLMKRLKLPCSVPPGKIRGGRFKWPSPIYDLVLDAIESRKDWNSDYYVSANEGKNECQLSSLQDTFVHFWQEGYDSGCAFHFGNE